jgi:hypothetical protein
MQTIHFVVIFECHASFREDSSSAVVKWSDLDFNFQVGDIMIKWNWNLCVSQMHHFVATLNSDNNLLVCRPDWTFVCLQTIHWNGKIDTSSRLVSRIQIIPYETVG